jgi:hypothetical protein
MLLQRVAERQRAAMQRRERAGTEPAQAVAGTES